MTVVHTRNKMASKRVYQCDICDKFYSLSQGLKVHVRNIHLKIGHKKCHICEAVMFRGHLKRHIDIVHNEEKKYQCKICDQPFGYPQLLRHHMTAKHEGGLKKLFKCEFCETSFGQKIYLDTHVKKVHEKQKNFKCEFCDKLFVFKSSLQKHGTLHKKPLIIDQCPHTLRNIVSN